jgi:GAF domain-containing protein
MEAGISLSEITALRPFGNQLLQCQNIHEVVEVVFEKIDQEIHPQVISLFLFSKDGRIRRFKIYGRDYQGQPIEDSWLLGESYLPGESFSGKAAAPSEDSLSPYGEPYICNDLEQASSGFINGKAYEEKLGFLKCGISVPLNGNNRTFGTIEVLNKIDTSTQTSSREMIFTDKEFCWLSIVGSHVSAAISRLREADETKVYANITRMLVDPQDSRKSSKEAYKSVTDQLVGELMPYKVCVLRLLDGKDTLFFVEESHTEDVTMQLKGFSSRKVIEGLVGNAFQSGKPIKIERIKDEADKFVSIEWIEQQKLKSFICFPLTVQGESVGVLSLFTGYEHEFTQDNMDFLENVSHLLAAYRVGIRRATEAKKMMASKVKSENEEDVNFEIIRQQKNELSERFNLLENKKKAFKAKLSIMLIQIVFGILVFLCFLYIVLAPYINPGLYSSLPKFSDILSSLVATVAFLWICFKLMKAKFLLNKIQQLSNFYSWGRSLLTRVNSLEDI